MATSRFSFKSRARYTSPYAASTKQGSYFVEAELRADSQRNDLAFSLSPGEAHDAVEGRKLLRTLPPPQQTFYVIMDRYEGNEIEPWQYDREMYKRRNEVERLFRRLKGFRRIFSGFDKLDVMFRSFIHFALIIEARRLC